MCNDERGKLTGSRFRPMNRDHPPDARRERSRRPSSPAPDPSLHLLICSGNRVLHPHVAVQDPPISTLVLGQNDHRSETHTQNVRLGNIRLSVDISEHAASRSRFEGTRGSSLTSPHSLRTGCGDLRVNDPNGAGGAGQPSADHGNHAVARSLWSGPEVR